MKRACLLLLTVVLLTACGRTEKAQNSTTRSATADTPATANTTVAAAPAKNCRSVVTADKLGKPQEYYESAKPIRVSLTLNQDVGTTETADGCYFNNTVTVLTTKKTGKQLFKRTMLKDDLLYFTKNDDLIKQSVLERVTYKPTFNGERYFNLTMQLIEPVSKKTSSYTLFMNYFGEIVKVK